MLAVLLFFNRVLPGEGNGLDSHQTIDFGVPRAIDHAHGPTFDLSFNLVASEIFVNESLHQCEMVSGLGAGVSSQSNRSRLPQ